LVRPRRRPRRDAPGPPAGRPPVPRLEPAGPAPRLGAAVRRPAGRRPGGRAPLRQLLRRRLRAGRRRQHGVRPGRAVDPRVGAALHARPPRRPGRIGQRGRRPPRGRPAPGARPGAPAGRDPPRPGGPVVVPVPVRHPRLPLPAPVSDGARRDLDGLHEAVLAWGAANLRALPWRATRDPWAALVSAVVAQQTGLARRGPHHPAFLERFPTPAACAAAPVAEVVRRWAGLGYNRQAVNLHRSAVAVTERDRKSTRLNSSHVKISYAAFCLKQKNPSLMPS